MKRFIRFESSERRRAKTRLDSEIGISSDSHTAKHIVARPTPTTIWNMFFRWRQTLVVDRIHATSTGLLDAAGSSTAGRVKLAHGAQPVSWTARFVSAVQRLAAEYLPLYCPATSASRHIHPGELCQFSWHPNSTSDTDTHRANDRNRTLFRLGLLDGPRVSRRRRCEVKRCLSPEGASQGESLDHHRPRRFVAHLATASLCFLPLVGNSVALSLARRKRGGEILATSGQADVGTAVQHSDTVSAPGPLRGACERTPYRDAGYDLQAFSRLLNMGERKMEYKRMSPAALAAAATLGT